MADNFFQQETQLAQKAIGHCATRLGETVSASFLPTKLITNHPLTSVATAAAVGIAAGLLLPLPRRNPPQPVEPTPEPHPHTFMANLEKEFLHALRPALQSVMVAATAAILTPKSPPQPPSPPVAE